jgi:hypothetical protein
MNQRVNIREFNRLANIIMKDLSNLPAEQLKEFNEIAHRAFLHTEFENSFRMSLENAKKEVLLVP